MSGRYFWVRAGYNPLPSVVSPLGLGQAPGLASCWLIVSQMRIKEDYVGNGCLMKTPKLKDWWLSPRILDSGPLY